MTNSILDQERVFSEDEQAECFAFMETAPSFIYDRQHSYKYFMIRNIESDLIYGVFEGKDQLEAWTNCRKTSKKDVFLIPFNILIEEISEKDLKANALIYQANYYE